MGMDFHVERKYDECKHCGRYKREELFYCGNDLFVETDPMTRLVENDDGKKVYRYGGTKSLAVLEEHMPSDGEYSGEDALERLEKVKHVIRDEYYQQIKEALQKDGTYMWWWA